MYIYNPFLSNFYLRTEETVVDDNTPHGPSPAQSADAMLEDNDLDVISKMSEEDIVLPSVEIRRIPIFRPKMQFRAQTLQPMKRPPWRP